MQKRQDEKTLPEPSDNGKLSQVHGCTTCPLAHDIFDSDPTCGHPSHGPSSALLHGLVDDDDQDGVMIPDYVPADCPLLDGPLTIELATTRKVTFLPTVKVGDVF